MTETDPSNVTQAEDGNHHKKQFKRLFKTRFQAQPDSVITMKPRSQFTNEKRNFDGDTREGKIIKVRQELSRISVTVPLLT